MLAKPVSVRFSRLAPKAQLIEDCTTSVPALADSGREKRGGRDSSAARHPAAALGNRLPVVAGLRGANPNLEAYFDQLVARAAKTLI